jgi:hypothetical protein
MTQENPFQPISQCFQPNFLKNSLSHQILSVGCVGVVAYSAVGQVICRTACEVRMIVHSS